MEDDYVVTLPIVEEAYRLFDAVHEIMNGPMASTTWLRKVHPELNGCSPITAIKAGRIADVWKLVEEMRK